MHNFKPGDIVACKIGRGWGTGTVKAVNGDKLTILSDTQGTLIHPIAGSQMPGQLVLDGAERLGNRVLGHHQPGKHADESACRSEFMFRSRLELHSTPLQSSPRTGTQIPMRWPILRCSIARSRIPLRPA